MPETEVPLHTHACACLEVTFLGSGSSGNATLVRCGDEALLVDSGFTARETMRRLEQAGADHGVVRAIVVTHEHSDHISGIRVLASKLDVPVYATAGTRRAAPAGSLTDSVEALTPGEPVRIAGMEVLPFAVSHDAAEPVGFRITGSCGTSFGLVTDSGVMTPESLEALAECELLGIECNHDPDLLRNGPYPWFLKERIASSRGHLSNAAAMEAVETLAHDRLRAVFGVHISSKNNTHDLVAAELRAALVRLGLDAQGAPVRQDRCSAVASVRPR